jgi:hypothetical protein
LNDERQRRLGLSDPRDAAVRLLAGAAYPALGTAARPVAEQSGHADAVTGVGVTWSRVSANERGRSIANAVTSTNSANDRSWRRVAATIQAPITAPTALQVSCR